MSFNWGFSPFTFKANIIMCEFDPVIMMIAGYFACLLIQFLHSVNDLYNLVWFSVADTGCFFPCLVLPSCKAGLVVTNSLSICLSENNLFSPSFMKLSLARYEILG